MHFNKIILFSFILYTISAQRTKIQKSNVLLSRRRRYLAFPEKSNFVVSLVLGSRFLQVQPNGWQITSEIDMPFPLPSDTLLFHNKHQHEHQQQISEKHYYQHWRTKRKVWDELKTAFNKTGFNGNACMEEMVCEAQDYIHFASKSMTKDMVTAIFNLDGIKDLDCQTPRSCNVPFFRYILGCLTPSY